MGVAECDHELVGTALVGIPNNWGHPQIEGRLPFNTVSGSPYIHTNNQQRLFMIGCMDIIPTYGQKETGCVVTGHNTDPGN